MNYLNYIDIFMFVLNTINEKRVRKVASCKKRR